MADPTLVVTAGTIVQAGWGTATSFVKALPDIDIPAGLTDACLIVTGSWGDGGTRQFIDGQLGGVPLVEYVPSEGEHNLGDFVGGSVFYLMNPAPGTAVSLSLGTSTTNMWSCATAFIVENVSALANGDTVGVSGYSASPQIQGVGAAGTMKVATFTLYDSSTAYTLDQTPIGSKQSESAFLNASAAVEYDTSLDPMMSLDCTVAGNGGHFANVFTLLGTSAGGVVATPGAGSITIAGQAPTVVATDNRTAQPGTGTLTITGQAPTVAATQNHLALPGNGALTLTGQAPTVAVTQNREAQPGAGALAITGQAPTVATTQNHLAEPGVGTITITGQQPAVLVGGDAIAQPEAGVLTITGLAPTVVHEDNQVALPSAGAVAITGLAPAVLVGDVVVAQPDAGALTFTGLAPTVVATASHVVEPGTGEVAFTGLEPSLAGAVVAEPEAGVLQFVGLAPTIINTSDDDSLLSPKYLGGHRPNVRSKGNEKPIGDEPLLPADVTNMPDAEIPRRRYSLMSSLAETVDEVVFTEPAAKPAPAAAPAAPKPAAKKAAAPAQAAPEPTAAPAQPAPEVAALAEKVADLTTMLVDRQGILVDTIEKLQAQVQELQGTLGAQAEAKVDALLDEIRRSAEAEIEARVDAELDRIRGRRANNRVRAEKIVSKILNS